MKPAFEIVKKGYDPEAVDKYVDFLREEYDQAVKINANLAARVQELEKTGKNQDDILQALVTAQGMARQIEAEAKSKAEALTAAAAAKAEQLLTEAKSNITQAYAEVKQKSDEIIAAAHVKAEQTTAMAEMAAARTKNTHTEIQSELSRLYEALSSIMKGGGDSEKAAIPSTENIN